MNKKQARKAAIDIICGLIYKEALSPSDLTDQHHKAPEDLELIREALFEVRRQLDNKLYPKPRLNRKFLKALEAARRNDEALATARQLLKDTEQDAKESAEYEKWLTQQQYGE